MKIYLILIFRKLLLEVFLKIQIRIFNKCNRKYEIYNNTLIQNLLIKRNIIK